jgi:hypothetical protein
MRIDLLGLMHPATRLPIVELDERAKAAVANALIGIDENQVGAAAGSYPTRRCSQQETQ